MKKEKKTYVEHCEPVANLESVREIENLTEIKVTIWQERVRIC